MVKIVQVEQNACRPYIAAFPIVDHTEVRLVVGLVLPYGDGDRLLTFDGRDFHLSGSDRVLVRWFDSPARCLKLFPVKIANQLVTILNRFDLGENQSVAYVWVFYNVQYLGSRIESKREVRWNWLGLALSFENYVGWKPFNRYTHCLRLTLYHLPVFFLHHTHLIMFLNRATSQKQWQAESQYVPPSAQPTFVRWRAFSPIGIIMFDNVNFEEGHE